MTEADAQTLAKLDEIAALLRIGFSSQIQAARTKLKADAVAAALLELAEGQVAGELVKLVSEKTGSGSRTIEQRMAELASCGALRREKLGKTTTYRSTGLF